MKNEAVIENAVVRQLQRRGFRTLKLNLQGRRGWPDRLVILPKGKVLWLEFKAPGKQPTRLQQHVHAWLRTAGHRVEVVDKKEFWL